MAGETLLLEAGAVFATLAIAGSLAHRSGQSVIPFYVVAGLVVSPAVLGALGLPAIQDRQFVVLLAELGIVFLLFFLGLEFSVERLVGSRDRIVRAGGLDLAVNFPAGVLLGLAFGWGPLEAFVLGGIVYISSSAVITKSLIDLGWIADAESEPILGTLVFEDLFMAFYLAVLSAVLLGGGDLAGAAVDVAISMGFLLALVVAVYRGTRLFDGLLAVGSKELRVLRTVGAVVLVAGVSLFLGLSEAVAAFFVGMGFSGTDRVADIEQLAAPLRDVFAAVFFFRIGLTTDPRLLLGIAGLLAAAVAVTTGTKLVTGYYGGRLYDLGRERSIRVAVGMVSRGEFSLIIAALAAAGSGAVLTETIPAFTVGYVLVMSILGTALMQRTDALGRLLPGTTEQRAGAP